MKKLLIIGLAAVSAFLSFGADNGVAGTTDTMFMYSADGETKGSGERLLPSQAVNLKTGQVVLGLARLTDEERAACGWYRVIPYQGEVASNQYFSCTGYLFKVEGTVEKIGVVKDRPKYKKITKYSKLRIYEASCAMGKWGELEQWMKDTTLQGVNIYQAWTFAQYLTDENELFSYAVDKAAEAMGLTPEQVKELLKGCEDGYENELIPPNGGSPRKVRRGFGTL